MNKKKIEKRWRQLKRIRASIILSFCILAPVTFDLKIIANIQEIILAVGLIILVTSSILMLYWKCPRCGKNYTHYFGSISLVWPLFTKCSKCDLPFGSTNFEEENFEKQYREETSNQCTYSHLPEDNTTDICKGCGIEIKGNLTLIRPPLVKDKKVPDTKK